MAQPIHATPSTKRYALVTGSNKGLGFEMCKQLASRGITVILTSRNEKKGIEAQERLKEFGFSENVIFHQLDVVDPASIASLVHFVQTEFGRLDILVNNAGITGMELEGDILIIQEAVEGVFAIVEGKMAESVQLKNNGKFIETFEGAEKCVRTNYYGTKRMTEAFIPLLQLSDSPRIVNVSSVMGHSRLLPNKWAKEVLLADVENLSEGKVDEVLQEFLRNFKDGSHIANDWPVQLAAYKVSKASINAYTRVIAKKYPAFCINCACPGFCRTDITANLGPLSAAEGAENLVRLAVLPVGGPSGLFFNKKEEFSF